MRPVFNPSQVIQNTQKMVLDASFLTLIIIKYWSRVSEGIQGKELCSFLYLGVVDIEKNLRVTLSRTTYLVTYIRVIIIIIIIISHRQHGSPWPSFATRLYRPSLPAGLQGYLLYRRRAVVYKFLLVVLPLLVHVKGSTGVCRLCVCPHLSSSVLHVWFV